MVRVLSRGSVFTSVGAQQRWQGGIGQEGGGEDGAVPMQKQHLIDASSHLHVMHHHLIVCLVSQRFITWVSMISYQ